MAAAVPDMAVIRPSDGALVALLRRLRAGHDDAGFVHRGDVCSAAPEDLVAGLAPAPGTDQGDDAGYSSVWYFYCPKRYKNIRGRRGGHRHRAVGAGGETCWHAETSPKEVEGATECGGTFANFSYGCKGKGSSRSFERMGWCMTEFDAADDKQDAAGQGDYVLCKVYRSSSSMAKRKASSSSSSSSSSSASSGCKKRKTAAGDHSEPARPAKMLIHDEQLSEPEPGSVFVETEYGPMPLELADISVDDMIGDMETTSPGECSGNAVHTTTAWSPQDVEALLFQFLVEGDEEQGGVQQPRAEPEQVGDELVDTEHASLMEEMLVSSEASSSSSNGMTAAAWAPPDPDFFDGVLPLYQSPSEGDEEQGVQQPRADAEQSGLFVEAEYDLMQWSASADLSAGMTIVGTEASPSSDSSSSSSSKGVQQPRAEPEEQVGEFVEPEHVSLMMPSSPLSQVSFGSTEASCSDASSSSKGVPTATWAPPDEDFFEGLPF